jgi:hypothetical protein
LRLPGIFSASLLGLVVAFGGLASAQTPVVPDDAADAGVPPKAKHASSAELAEPTPEEIAEAYRISQLPIIHQRPYDQPSSHDLFVDYLRDTYGLPGQARSLVRALYSEARGTPSGWGTDLPGFGQRLGSAEAVTAINGNVRYGMEIVFHEDLRYIPCHGCSVKHKIENALLAEITARHDVDGHRFFTLTPTIADFSGPIIAHTLWYPGSSAGPLAGVVSARTVFATRVGAHLFREFVLERRHRDIHETP